MKNLSSISITLLLFLFVSGCQNQNDPIEITDSSNTPVNTMIPNITLTPTKDPTLVPIASPTQTLSIQFPEWVKNPKTQILLVPVGTRDKGYENMALFNAETGERFDIPFTEEVGDYFWMPDGSQFGFLPENENQVTLFEINDGSVSYAPLSKESLGFLYHNSDSDPIQITSSNITDPNLLIIPVWYSLSSDHNYFVYQEGYDNTYTSIFDISTNQTINISDPSDGYFDLFSEFSPNSPFLAISEVDQEPLMYYSFDAQPSFRLRIYDVHSHQMIASYKDVTIPNWSPDGTKFLFQEWTKSDYYGYSYWISPPCIYDSVDGKTNCYHETLTDNDRVFSSLDWSPDQSRISYVYDDKGFCTVALPVTTIKCILAKVDIEDNFIREYSWSPDSNFISFEFDSVGPYSDDNDNPRLGIANVETGEYFPIGENINMHQLGLWRPLFNP